MVDEEVETTLREIRDRVRAAAEAEASRAVVTGADNESIAFQGGCPARTPEAIASIEAYLTTTGRAWDRLPPVVSNRGGGLARLELWIKQRFKEATRWYTWEQVNFNAAVHNALRDTRDALVDLEQRLGQMRAEQHLGQMRAEQRLGQMRVETEKEMTRLRAEIKAYRDQMEAELSQRARSLEVNARLVELNQELRVRDQRSLDEQRVCFKQLSLEMSEAEVLLDRARREIESRLDKLESPKRGNVKTGIGNRESRGQGQH